MACRDGKFGKSMRPNGEITKFHARCPMHRGTEMKCKLDILTEEQKKFHDPDMLHSAGLLNRPVSRIMYWRHVLATETTNAFTRVFEAAACAVAGWPEEHWGTVLELKCPDCEGELPEKACAKCHNTHKRYVVCDLGGGPGNKGTPRLQEFTKPFAQLKQRPRKLDKRTDKTGTKVQYSPRRGPRKNSDSDKKWTDSKVLSYQVDPSALRTMNRKKFVKLGCNHREETCPNNCKAGNKNGAKCRIKPNGDKCLICGDGKRTFCTPVTVSFAKETNVRIPRKNISDTCWIAIPQDNQILLKDLSDAMAKSQWRPSHTCHEFLIWMGSVFATGKSIPPKRKFRGAHDDDEATKIIVPVLRKDVDSMVKP